MTQHVALWSKYYLPDSRLSFYNGQSMETYSLSRLFEMTGVERRTLKKYLSDIAPDKVMGKRSEYSFRSAAIALCKNHPKYKFEGGMANATDPSTLEPRDRNQWYDAENKRLQYEASVRELIPVEEVRTTVAEALKIITFALDTLPDRVEHEVGLQPDQLKVFIDSLDDARQSLAQNLEAYFSEEHLEDEEQEAEEDNE